GASQFEPAPCARTRALRQGAAGRCRKPRTGGVQSSVNGATSTWASKLPLRSANSNHNASPEVALLNLSDRSPSLQGFRAFRKQEAQLSASALDLPQGSSAREIATGPRRIRRARWQFRFFRFSSDFKRLQGVAG